MPYGEVFLEKRNKDWNTPYLFNGKEQDEESGLYYYGARYYDARKSLWLSVDPLAEIYPETSAYMYCAGNPVKFVDYDGKRFTEVAEEWVSNMEKEIENEISKIDSKEKIRFYDNIKKVKLQAVQNEINVLRESNQVYDVRTYRKECLPTETDLRGYVSYDQDKDQFVININMWRDASTEGSVIGTFAHELKHAYQFEMGRLSFKSTGSGITVIPGYLYDYTDELEAHERGTLFGAVGYRPDNRYKSLKLDETSINPNNYEQYSIYAARKKEIFRQKQKEDY